MANEMTQNEITQNEFSQNISFAEAFAPPQEGRWRELALAALKGRPIESLESTTYDAIKIHPLYLRQPPQSQPHRERGSQSANHWTVMARVDCPDAAQANEFALIELENGANGLHVVMEGAVGAYGFGLKGPEALEVALKDVRLDYGVAVEMDAPGFEAAVAMAQWVRDQKFDEGQTKISFGLDLTGALMRDKDPARVEESFVKVIRALKAQNFQGPFAVADARIIHAAGGTEAQEVAFALGAAIHVMRRLENSGFSLEEARDAVGFRLALDADEFLSIAKLRALRRLWAIVQNACALTPKAASIHGESAWRMTTRRDPYVNMLRATVAVFAGAVGGADRISVLPFTQALGLPDGFARRVARNTQLVLGEEAHLDKVVDPAAGAGGFEAITCALAQQAWELFQAQEAAGGLLASCDALDRDVAKVRMEREKNSSQRKDAITGVSEFPFLKETTPKVLVLAPQCVAPSQTLFPPMRLSKPFETLRERSDAMASRGARATIFLANFGPISAFNARATFAKNFFEAGGFESLGNDGFEDIENAAQAFAQSGAEVACICSSDTLYADHAAPLSLALKDKGAKMVLLAGRPGAAQDSLMQAGVDEFIFSGGDVLGTLQKIWSKIS